MGEGETGRQGGKSSRAKTSDRPISPSPHHPVSRFPGLPTSLSIITLLTDFGSADYFVGALKGVILSLNSLVRIVDITHEIPPHEIADAAFTLLAAYRSFPAQTIHLAVVDPGVGSSRRPLVVSAGDQFFVGPDNGIFSYLIDREPQARIFHVTNGKYFHNPVSATFHGRDVFAPVAAALSLGVKPEQLSSQVDDCIRLPPLAAMKSGKGRVAGRIIHIDRFGNCVTNLTQQDLTLEMITGGARLKIKGKSIKAFRRFYADEVDDDAKLFGIWGSAGFLEIAATNRSAAKLLKARCGDNVVVSVQ